MNFNLALLSNCNFLNEIHLSYSMHNFGKNLHQTEKNQINCFNCVLFYWIVRIAYSCVTTEKNNNFIAFHESFIPKIYKNNQHLKNMQSFGFIVGNEDGKMILIMISHVFQ